MINAYFFLLLKLLHAIAKSCQINWRIERTKICGSIFFCKDMTKIKLLVGNSAIAKAYELENIKFTFKIFRMPFFTFMTF